MPFIRKVRVLFKTRPRPGHVLCKTHLIFPRIYGPIDYNFSLDDGTGSKFGTHNEPIVLNIFKIIAELRARSAPAEHHG